MFKNLIRKIKLWRKRQLRHKFFQIRNAVIKWYSDYDRIYDVCDIPAHTRADRAIGRTIKRPADIDRCYRKLLEFQAQI